MAPAETTSAIFVAAYKRYVLLSLHQYARVLELPKVHILSIRLSMCRSRPQGLFPIIRGVREHCKGYDVRHS